MSIAEKFHPTPIQAICIGVEHASSQTARHDKVYAMTEQMPYSEPRPDEIEIRRDALEKIVDSKK